MSSYQYRSITEYYTDGKSSQGHSPLTIQKTRVDNNNTRDPRVWGPALWLFLHISSINYVYNPMNADMQRQFILSLPFTLPCEYCSNHAKEYVSNFKSKLQSICLSRETLFKFYVDFHNYVNQRHNKKLFTYKEAWDMYSDGANILDFSF